MRSITVILSALVVLASGHYMTKQVKYADKDFLVKQKFVFDILQHIHQDEIFYHKYGDMVNYHIKDHYDHYDKAEFVKEFVEHYEHHPLPEEEIFSIMDEHHAEYAEQLVHAIYLAKDWDTYQKTVVWARFHCNKQLFIYAFHVATIARHDMEGIVFPAIYEIYPYYFFGAETIQKAQLYKMEGFEGVKKIEDVYTVAIPSNYTGIHGHVNEDNLLSYFTEDVGLNAFYYYYNLDYPYWTQGKPEAPLKNDRRGSFYFFVHWQLLARYYMERLSHDLSEIEEFNWYEKMTTGYHTGLRYYNGIHFPNRDNEYHFYHSENYELVDFATLYDHRIMNAIDLGYIVLKDGTHFDLKDPQVAVEAIGNLVQGNEDSLNQKFYGDFDILLRYLLNEGIPYGRNEDVLPGVLMHYETSMRDPAFYQMYKRILRYFWHIMDEVEPYTEKDLVFPNVKIEGVEMDKLVTYYDKFDSDITNAVDVEHIKDVTPVTDLLKFGRVSHYEGHDFLIKARQYRLNHLPFTFKLSVNSDKAQKAVVKVFIGPKYDHFGHKIHFAHNRENFVELEHFVVDLTAGKNVITRSSDDYSWFVHDRTTYFELYKEIMHATNTADHKFTLDMSEAHCGFPSRLMLPRGKKGGMPFQFMFYVMPYHEPKVHQFTGYDPTISCGVGSGARYVDDSPFGFPLDRHINMKYWHDIDNMYFYDTMIFHKTEAEVNAVHH